MRTRLEYSFTAARTRRTLDILGQLEMLDIARFPVAKMAFKGFVIESDDRLILLGLRTPTPNV